METNVITGSAHGRTGPSARCLCLRTVNSSINIGTVSEMAEGDEINLSEMGFDKLLGRGSIDRALRITVNEASAKAIEKVEAAGGTVEMVEEDNWEEE